MKTLDRLFLPLLICLIGLLHVSLSGQGALSLGDERRYLQVLSALSRLQEGEGTLVDFLGQLPALTHGRPVAGVYWSLLAGFHLSFFSPTGGDPLSPDNLRPIQMLNAAPHLVSIVLFFLLCRALALTKYPARIATVLYALLPSGFLFTRHFFPYHLALGFCFLSLVLLFRAKPSGEGRLSWHAGCAGACAALSFLSYPGFYFHAFTYGTAALFIARSRRVPVLGLFPFVLGAVLPFLVFEGLTLGVRGGLGDQLHALSHTVIIGSFAESGVYAFKYLLMAEGMLGFLLLLALPSALMAYSSNQLSVRSAGVVAAGAFAALAFHAGAGVIAESMVFYGRLMTGLTPLLIIFLVAAMEVASQRRIRLYVLLGGGLLSLASSVLALRVIAYPRDVLYMLPDEVMQRSVRTASIEQCEEIQRGPMPLVLHREGDIPPDHWVLQNFCTFFPVTGARAAFLEARPVLYSAWHYATYPPYLFELYGADERSFLQERIPVIAVYGPK